MSRIHIFNEHPRSRVPRAETIHLVNHVLRGEECRSADINVIFTNDRTMLGLNTKYLNHPYQTDVISFPLEEKGPGTVEGEVYVNIEQARRQARIYIVTKKNELSRLVIHGVLHLLGYEDSTKHRKNKMTAKENHYLESLSGGGNK